MLPLIQLVLAVLVIAGLQWLFYRTALGQPWNNFIGSAKEGPTHRRVMEKKSYPARELAAMKTVFQARR